MPQTFTITLTGEEAEQVNKLAAYWRVTPDEALRRPAVDGLDMAMQIKAHDEAQGNPFRRARPGRAAIWTMTYRFEAGAPDQVRDTAHADYPRRPYCPPRLRPRLRASLDRTPSLRGKG